jgi:hypothetical protein
MRRLTLLLSLALAMSLYVCAGALAAESEWHSEQPVAAGIGVPVPLGAVGGMAFWAPNKGVLVTDGNGGMPAGVYAYDGSGWYLYSTVCGGGREGGGIAISGPDEFWTISDYGEAQEGTGGTGPGEYSRTLCHFANGEVVASYAEPASANAYQRMDAAACSGAADCWFGGEAPERSPNQDPFHLHWDGSSITAVPSTRVREPEVASLPGSVESLAFAEGRLFESAGAAPYLREVSLAAPARFLPIEPLASPGPFVLSTEPLEQRLWAGSETGSVLHLGANGFEELPTTAPTFLGGNGKIRAIGAEPGAEAAWLGGGEVNEGAEVRQVAADGSLGPIVELPSASEDLNPKGPASHIFCASPGQCWMTTESGWLFHLGGPPAEGVNTDPLMHRLITSRPKDASSRTFVSAGLPPDDSGEVEPSRAAPILHEQFPHPRKRPPLVVKIKQSVIHRTILQLAFTLRGKAHVQLIAKYHKSVVAKTPRLTLGKGRHRLRLHLDPKRWPTSLAFPVHAVAKPKSK